TAGCLFHFSYTSFTYEKSEAFSAGSEKMLFSLAEGFGRGIAGLEDICCIPVIMTMICSKLETCDG
ncbi:MAG: hypothetical protein ACI32N_09100, partial [Bulleidia sp.]